MILAQNKLQPQEEIDENGNCGRLPTTGRIYSMMTFNMRSPELLAQEIRRQLRSGLNASSIFITVLSRRPVKRIEKQRESRLRLRAVLRTQAEQDDAARIHFDGHDRRPPRHPLFAAQPARG